MAWECTFDRIELVNGGGERKGMGSTIAGKPATVGERGNSLRS